MHSGGSAKRADAIANRARILDAAQSVFAECGLELDMHKVAKRAQLGVGTLYSHFANREELLGAIVRQAVEDTFAQLQEAQASHIADPVAAFQTLVLVGLHVQQQYQHLFAVIRDPRLATLLDPSYGQIKRSQFLELPRALINHGIQAGIFRRDIDQDMAAVTIMGAFITASDLLETYDSLDELAQRLSQFLLTLFTGKTEESQRDSSSPTKKVSQERKEVH